jgi:hypothetical protein
VATVAVFAVSAYGYVNKGFWGRYTDGQIQMLGVGENRDSYVDYVLRFAKTTRTTDEFSDPDEGNDLFVIGDSYSADFLNALNEGGFLEGLEVLGYKISWDCLNVPESSDYKEFLKPKDVDKCVGAVRVGHPDLASRIQEADFVLLASSWMDYTTSQLDELLAAVESQTDVPVLIVGRKQFGRLNAQELASYTEQEFLSRRQKDETRLKWMKAVPESVKGNYLDVHRLFCGDNDDCPIATPEGRLVSYDGHHLTRDGAVHLSRLLSSDEDFTRRWEAAFGDYMCPEIRDEGVPCPIGIYADDAKIEPYSGPKDKLHIYLLIGQSNMAGRAFFAPEESGVIERSYVLNGDGNWESAKNPLNRYSTIRKGLDKQKMNPGYMFAKTMIEKDKDVSIGLVVNARADTKISQWAKGTEFYNDALKRVETARETGILKGVLWHQGESDAKNAEYLDQLKTFIADLRKDLKEPNLPFVAGQVNNIKLINDQIAELPENVPYTGFVSSEGLKTSDNTHFDAKSMRLLGNRYAIVMQKLVNSEQKESSKTK